MAARRIVGSEAVTATASFFHFGYRLQALDIEY